MKLIHLDSRCVVDDDGCAVNLKSSLARSLPTCEPQPERTGRLAVCGAAPSVRTFLHELKDYDEVWAVNGAYKFLLDQGIVPQGFVALDPVPGLAEYVACAHKDTTHYISLMCDPSVFDALDGFKVMTWVPAQAKSTIRFPPGLALVPGGTTALSRTPALAKLLGWRDVTISGPTVLSITRDVMPTRMAHSVRTLKVNLDPNGRAAAVKIQIGELGKFRKASLDPEIARLTANLRNMPPNWSHRAENEAKLKRLNEVSLGMLNVELRKMDDFAWALLNGRKTKPELDQMIKQKENERGAIQQKLTGIAAEAAPFEERSRRLIHSLT